MTSKIFTGAVIVILIVIAGFYYNRYRIAPEMSFDALELTDLDNVPVKFDSFKDKKVLVDFFATWCGPCVKEFSEIEQAQAMLQDKNFVFVCISDEPVERLKFFKERMHLNVRILHSSKKFESIHIFTFPTNYLMNEKACIVFKKTGELNLNGSELAEELIRLTK